MEKNHENKEITEAQKLMFKLMKIASFNDFDGEKVVSDLEDNKELWEAVYMNRPIGLNGHVIFPLLPLRDLSENEYNVDTVYILPAIGKEDQLLKLVESWGYATIKWIDGDMSDLLLGGILYRNILKILHRNILKIWWD